MPTLNQLRLAERENGYKQAHNDMLKVMIQFMAEEPLSAGVLNELLTRFKQQLAIREVSSFAHPEEVVNPSIPL